MIHQTITSPLGREQYLHICEQPLRDEDMRITVHGADQLEAIQVANKAKYGNVGLQIPAWNAGVLHYRGATRPNDLSNLEFHVSSTYHSQAIRQGLTDMEDDMPITVIGIVETLEGHVLAGVRRGAIQGDKISVMPFGYNDHDRRPVEQFRAEGIEEAAHPTDAYSSIRVIGAQFDPDFTNGLSIVIYAKSTLGKEEISQRHGDALAIYQAAQQAVLSEGGEAYKARKAGKAAVQAHYILLEQPAPIDAGDHDPLIFLREAEIREMLASNYLFVTEPPSQKLFSRPVMAPTKGALAIYENCRDRGVLPK